LLIQFEPTQTDAEMMKSTFRACVPILFLAAVLVDAPAAHAQLTVDIESGWVEPGYNDVRIPGDGGTQFSLTRELSVDGQVYARARIGVRLGTRHHVSALYAPLAFDAAGALDRDIVFEQTTFPAGTPLAARYKFNSYRLTWRYDLVTGERIAFGLGITGKVRDAEVALSGGGESDSKTDLGFVPLINLHFDWRATGRTGLLIDGDALAAPQGRAVDMMAAAWWEPTDRLRLRLGYRILEGGADNDEVYNFSLFHYAVAGVHVTF
jgi:hypothetical protein